MDPGGCWATSAVARWVKPKLHHLLCAVESWQKDRPHKQRRVSTTFTQISLIPPSHIWTQAQELRHATIRCEFNLNPSATHWDLICASNLPCGVILRSWKKKVQLYVNIAKHSERQPGNWSVLLVIFHSNILTISSYHTWLKPRSNNWNTSLGE